MSWRLRGAVTLVLVAAACSPPSSLVEYAADVESAAIAFDDDLRDLQTARAADLTTEVGDLEAGFDRDDPSQAAALVAEAVALTATRMAGLFGAVADRTDRFVATLDDLRVPAEAVDLHEEYVASLRASSMGIPGILDALGTANSFDAIDAAIAGSGFADTQQRLERACRALQEYLRVEPGESLDLRCPGDATP